MTHEMQTLAALNLSLVLRLVGMVFAVNVDTNIEKRHKRLLAVYTWFAVRQYRNSRKREVIYNNIGKKLESTALSNVSGDTGSSIKAVGATIHVSGLQTILCDKYGKR